MPHEFVGIPTHHWDETGDKIMARKQRDSSLESRTARLKLRPRGKPYAGPLLARGIRQDYRRNKTGNGSWIARVANGHGRYWIKVVADADDFDESNNQNVLTFFEAQKPIKQLARGEDGSAGAAPITVEGALANYRADLITGASNPYNADWPLLHLTDALKFKPAALITSDEWKKWRESMLVAMERSTVNRLCACIRAALNLAARHDKRISNHDAWTIGLAALPNAQKARNVILPDDTVRAFVATAYAIEDKFGLFTDTLAVTGARPSQAARLRVEDLRDHLTRPSLWMPKSGKGGKRSRAEKKLENYSVPITTELAARLRAAARGRPDHARLLLHRGVGYHREVKQVVAAIGLDPAVVTLYALRHSSIVRALLKNVPTSVVADQHNTSEAMIRKHYAKFISDHSDDISRHALLQHAPLNGANVIALR